MARKPQILHDDSRSALGLGWEASRRGVEFSSNPYEPGSWKYSSWAEGWLRYRDTLLKPATKKVLEIGKSPLGRKPDAPGQQKKSGA
jgi:hypothetical protein